MVTIREMIQQAEYILFGFIRVGSIRIKIQVHFNESAGFQNLKIS